jgi:hypothetical protein
MSINLFYSEKKLDTLPVQEENAYTGKVNKNDKVKSDIIELKFINEKNTVLNGKLKKLYDLILAK